jgi:hypothetical protein
MLNLLYLWHIDAPMPSTTPSNPTTPYGSSLSPKALRDQNQKEYLRWKYVAEFGEGTVTTRKSQERRSETWKIDSRIGEGGYGEVYKQCKITVSDE